MSNILNINNMAFTQEEKEKIKQAGLGGGTAMTSSRPSLIDRTGIKSITQNTVEPSFFSNPVTDIKGAVERGRAEKTAIEQSYAEGKIGLPIATLQSAGNVVGTAFDIGANLPVVKQGLELFGMGVKELAKTPQVQQAGEDLAPIMQKALEWYDALSPEQKRTVKATGNIASILPVSKATGAGIKTGVKTGEAVIAPGVKATGEAVAATGRATKALGKATFEGAITPTVPEAERLLSYKAKAPFLTRVSETIKGKTPSVKAPQTRATTALEHGMGGTQTMLGVQGKREADLLWKDTIQPAVKNSKAIVSKEELFAPIEERIAKTIEPSKKTAYQDAFDALKEDYANIENFTLEDAQSVKRTLDEFTPIKQFRGKDVANELNVLKNDMADAIRQKTYESLDDINIKKSYLDWANLHELEKIGVKAISSESRLAGSGKLVSGLWDMATVPIRTVGGQILYRVGNFFEFIGNKGIKKFGDFLKGKGYEIPKSEGIEVPK
jgi:hypothetical protein